MDRFTGINLIICFLIAVSLFTGCSSTESESIKASIREYSGGVRTRDREAVSHLVAESIEIITPFENTTLSRDQFLDRIFRADLHLIHYSLTPEPPKILGNRASVEIFETSEALFANGTSKSS